MLVFQGTTVICLAELR